MMPSLRPSVTLGVLLSLGCYAVYAFSDGFVKAAGHTLGIFEIGLFTTIFSLLPVAFAKPAGERWQDTFRLHHPWLVNLIAICRVGSAVLATYAFVSIPLAEVYSIVFLIPVFITILGVAVLREEVTIERWLLVIISFLGVLLVVRPGFRELQLGHLAAVACAFVSATATTAMRVVSGTERRISLFLIPSLYTIAFNGVMMAIFGWIVPDLGTMALLLLAGLCGGIGFLMQIVAVTYAPASRIAPMQYSQIVWALIMGVLFFSEIPDLIAIIGMGVVIASGVANIMADGARARIAGRWAQFRARRSTTPDDSSRISGPPEV